MRRDSNGPLVVLVAIFGFIIFSTPGKSCSQEKGDTALVIPCCSVHRPHNSALNQENIGIGLRRYGETLSVWNRNLETFIEAQYVKRDSLRGQAFAFGAGVQYPVVAFENAQLLVGIKGGLIHYEGYLPKRGGMVKNSYDGPVGGITITGRYKDFSAEMFVVPFIQNGQLKNGYVEIFSFMWRF